MALKTFDFKQVPVILGGIQMAGFADGEAIALEFDADEWTTYVGNDGETTRARTNNGLARLTITLAQSSESNLYLTSIGRTGAVFPAMVKDNTGNSVYASEQAYVQSRPNPSFGREVQTREWVIVMPDMQWVEGGN